MTKRIEKPKKNNGITEGVIWKQILSFFFPILFGTFFQLLYNTVDAIVVGQFLGKQALAAVGGGTGVMINLIVGFFTGIASGATVVISQFYGAKDYDKTEKAVHTAILLSIVGGIFISIVGYICTRPLLRLINTPDDILDLATEYLHIYFIGALSVVVYNIGAGIFRAAGDSKHPLYFLIAGSFINIVLDILFIGPLKMGVGGAALATVLSQVFSAIITLIWLHKRTDGIKLSFKALRFNLPILKNMLYIGLPSAIQSIMYNVSNMIIQTKINSFGTDTAAAYAAYGKLDFVFWMIINSFGIAITTFVGQNYGAGKIERAKKGVKEVFLMAGVTVIVLELVYIFFGRYGYYIFVTDQNVIDIGMRIMMAVAPFYFTYISIELLSGAIRGTGKAIIPTLFTVFGICLLRIIWLSIPFCTKTVERVMYSYPVSWSLVSILFIIYYKTGDIYDEKKKHNILYAEKQNEKLPESDSKE